MDENRISKERKIFDLLFKEDGDCLWRIINVIISNIHVKILTVYDSFLISGERVSEVLAFSKEDIEYLSTIIETYIFGYILKRI